MLFALEPDSATPSTPTFGLVICGNTQLGSLIVRILTKGKVLLDISVPVGMFADGGSHEIAVSISRKSHTVTYFLDQKIMNKHSYVSNNGDGIGEMPTFAVGKFFLGAMHTPWTDWRYLPVFIGRMKNAYIETDNRLPFQDMYQVVGFNERGYGSCIGYSDGLVDQVFCGDFYETEDPIFMPSQRFSVNAKFMLNAVNVGSQFVFAECRVAFLKYACGSYIMPCATHEHGGIQYSFPRSPCRSQCETFMTACRDDLIGIEDILHAIPTMSVYTAKLYDTFCDLTVWVKLKFKLQLQLQLQLHLKLKGKR
jgi:hypothetical protein